MSVNNEILISVIVPVYNAERFVDRAVQSVLCQMDGTVELVLVNDGSVDASGALCDGYALHSDNVHVIHKENGGISSARNAGMAAAIGQYFMFLDADDYLEKDTCRTVGEVIRAERPDCIDFGWRYISNGEPQSPAFHKLPKSRLLGENELRERILPPLLNLCNDPDHFIFDFAWAKVFKADIVRDNNVYFDEGRRIWEDRPFVVHYLRYCRNYYAIDRCFYNYVDVPGSLSRRYSLDFFRIILENFHQYKHLYADTYDFDAQYVNDYWCHSIENMIFRSLEQKDSNAQIRQIIMDTLRNEQVVHWYANRNPQNAFEKKMSSLVVSGQSEKALSAYKNRMTQTQRKQTIDRLTCEVKRAVKKVLGR